MTRLFTGTLILGAGLALIAALSPLQAQTPQATTPQAATPAAVIETRTYDNWTVSCRAAPEAKSGKACSTELRMVKETDGKKTILLHWVFGFQNNKLMSVISVPTGLLLAPGIEMKMGSVRQIKVALSQCAPSHCEAVLPSDEALYKDLALVPQTEVTVVILDGRALKYAVNMKGLDKALDDIRRNAAATKAR